MITHLRTEIIKIFSQARFFFQRHQAVNRDQSDLAITFESKI